MPQIIPVIIAAASAVGAFIQAYGIYIALASTVYGVINGREQARRARNTARDRYNDSLTDRTVTLANADSPWQICYGEPVTGGRIVAQLLSGERDQFQHLVVVWADHECDAIVDTLLAGESIGTLDSNGWVTSGRWVKTIAEALSDDLVLNGSGSGTLARPAAGLVSLSWYDPGEGDSGPHDHVLAVADLTIVGSTVTVPSGVLAAWAGRTVRANYSSGRTEPMVRVRHHLGGTGQVADPVLVSECPGQWSASDVLTGKCYSIFTFCLDEPELQGGPPGMTVRLRGKKLYDHRTATTAWSRNNALMVADYLMGEYGKAQPSNALVWATFDSAANVCDEALASQDGAARYCADGVVLTDSDPDQTLTAMCQSMGGFLTLAGGWYLHAGAYTAPVMALGAGDAAGSVEVVASGEGLSVFNGVRGQFYDRARFDQKTDYTPYSNSAFVAEDGGAAWETLNLPFTVDNWRAANLARIMVERSRGMTLAFPAKARARTLRVGQRVTLTLPFLNLDGAVFRVAEKTRTQGGPVLLLLKQDDASYYDEADAPATLTSPTMPSTNPFVVDAPTDLVLESTEATALRDGDGLVISRLKVSWAASTDTLVLQGGALQLEYRLAAQDEWQRVPELAADSTSAYVMGLLDRRVYFVRVRWRNALGVLSDWLIDQVVTDVATVVGLQSAQLQIYQRAASTPALPGAAATYTFATGALTGLTNGWLSTIPGGSEPLYTSVGRAIGAAATASVAASVWSAAVVMAQDGAAGEPGPGAVNWMVAGGMAATGNVLANTASSSGWGPRARSVERYYNSAAVSAVVVDPSKAFRIGLTSDNGFSTSWPTYPYNVYFDFPGDGSWSVVQAGSVVSSGGGGVSAGTLIQIHLLADGTASAVIGNLVIGAGSGMDGGLWAARVEFGSVGASLTSLSFGAGGQSGPPGSSVEVQYSVDGSSWHSSFTTGDLYMRQRVGTGSWSAAIRIVGEDGTDGSTGNFIDYVFKRAASLPATPTGGGTPSGWSDAPPADDGNPLWMTTAEKTAANALVGAWATPVRLDGPAGAAGASVEVQYSVDGSSWHSSFTTGDLYMRQRVGTGSWSAAIRIVGEDGTNGSTGNFIDYVFKRAASLPATPTGGGTPSGWYDAPPADDGNPLWMTTAEKTAANTLVGSWSTPVKITGETGSAGVDAVLYTVTYYDATGLIYSNLG